MGTELAAIILLLLIILILLIFTIFRQPGNSHDFKSLYSRLDQLERLLRDELALSRKEASDFSRNLREEVSSAHLASSDFLLSRLSEQTSAQKNQLDIFSNQLTSLTRLVEMKLSSIQETTERQLQLIQSDNSAKLEMIRSSVEEKLHSAIEKRLGESFRLVSDRLELVHKGLGEMHNLAQGVGDLKKVISNVKTRGVFGEVQLAALLEQILSPEQYSRNVAVKDGVQERVEFAIKIPGIKDDLKSIIWLPVDAKFPMEDYQRLCEASELSDINAVNQASKALDKSISKMASDICSKYINPPTTTDFAILYLPTEGLYAEVIRKAGMVEELMKSYRVVIAGPTTLAALLNSLQIGLQTVALEKRSGEVWKILEEIRCEFGRFGDLLEKTKRKLEEAGSSIDLAAVRSRAIEKRLKSVHSTPPEWTTSIQPE